MAVPPPQIDVAALLDRISDPLRGSVEQAVAAAREAMELGEPVDSRLGVLVSKELTIPGNSLRLRHLLDVLGALDGGQHILDARSALLAHPDPEVRSRATLIVGRTSRNAEWVMRRLLDPDPSVQASAVESVWGIDTPEMRKVLDTAVRSPHARVVANALVGLYRVGVVASIAKIFDMAQHSAEPQRLYARWAMGETEDPRFLPYLNAVFRTDPPGCRAMVIRALARIRRNIAACEQSGPAPVKILSVSGSAASERRMLLGVSRQGAGESHGLFSATDFVIEEDGRPVVRYSAARRTDPDAVVSGFVIPRILSRAEPYAMGIESGVRQCIPLRRRADVWSIDRYCCDDALEPEDGPNLPAMRSEDPLIMTHLRKNRGFLAAPEVIERVLAGLGRKEEASRDVLASMEKTIEILSRGAGERHLFVFFHPNEPFPEESLEDLANRLSGNKVALHGFLPAGTPEESPSPQTTPALAEICAASGGTFFCLPPEQIAASMTALFDGLLSRYDIAWWPPEVPGHSARMRIFSRCGCADLTVELA